MTNRTRLTIGARSSRLSLAQAETVRGWISAAFPGIEVTIREFTTTGDRLLDTPLPLIGGKGVFTEEIEGALLAGAIDLAVHSLKDLPVENRAGLRIGAVPERGDVADVLVSRSGLPLNDLPVAARIGTSSLRRSAQLRSARPDLEPMSIRGNVETRLRKLSDPEQGFDAIVLALAGMERLGLLDRVTEQLSMDVMLPAPGQGALAVQCRDEPASLELLSTIDHIPSGLATTAERAFLAGLGGGCSMPVAAYGLVDGAELRLRGRVLAVDGGRVIDVESRTPCESSTEAQAAGQALAGLALERGAAHLLAVNA